LKAEMWRHTATLPKAGAPVLIFIGIAKSSSIVLVPGFTVCTTTSADMTSTRLLTRLPARVAGADAPITGAPVIRTAMPASARLNAESSASSKYVSGGAAVHVPMISMPSACAI